MRSKRERQMRVRKTDTDKQRERAVNKGWYLVQNYRKEDPQRHLADGEEELVKNLKRRDVPNLLLGEMLAYQAEVLTWLELGMASWLNFYFALGEAKPEDRLEEAAEGLGKASERLHNISEQMAHLPGLESGWGLTVRGYREAVEMWSTAMDLIARGALFDRDPLAREGLDLLTRASDRAEDVVEVESGPSRGVDINGPLGTLHRIQPSDRVSPRAVEEAKTPWERALIVAGSRIDWFPTPS